MFRNSTHIPFSWVLGLYVLLSLFPNTLKQMAKKKGVIFDNLSLLSWVLLDYLGFSWIVFGFFGLSLVVLDCLELSHVFLDFLGLFWVAWGCFGLFWVVSSCLGLPYVVLECLGLSKVIFYTCIHTKCLMHRYLSDLIRYWGNLAFSLCFFQYQLMKTLEKAYLVAILGPKNNILSRVKKSL